MEQILTENLLFLGGTCNGSTWREVLVPLLEEKGIPYFNPVVKDWNSNAQKVETCIKYADNTINLFVITKEMKGVYSIAEVVDMAHRSPERTIFYFDREGFDSQQIHSLEAVEDMLMSLCVSCPDTLERIPEYYKSISNRSSVTSTTSMPSVSTMELSDET